MKKYIGRYTGIGFCAIGLVLIAMSIGADMFGIGARTGFGMKQWSLLINGGFLLLIGIGISSSRGQRYVDRWVTPDIRDARPLLFVNWQDKLIKVITIAMWFGIISGLIESYYRLIQRYVQYIIVNRSLHLIWIVPLTLMILFLILGLIFILINLAWPRWMTFQVIIFGLSVFSLMSLYFLKSNIHVVAALLLAAGISFQLSRIIIRRQTLFYEFVQASFRWIVVFVLSIAAFMIGFYK